MFQGYLKEVHMEVSNVYQGLIFQGCFKEAFRVFQRRFKGGSKKFERCFIED